jgi:hypothetical protein
VRLVCLPVLVSPTIPSVRRVLRLVLASSLLFVPVTVGAQEPPRAASGYGGVSPGSGNPPPAQGRLAGPRRARRAASVVLTWPGFQMQPDGSSRFFVQSSGPVETEIRESGERLEIVFRNATIHLRNSALWLETRHFETPVERARLERRGRDMVLVMHRRALVAPRVSTGAGADPTFQYVYVDFPAGQYRPAEPEEAPRAEGSVGMVSGGATSNGATGPAQPPASQAAPAGREPRDDERPPPVRGPAPKL